MTVWTLDSVTFPEILPMTGRSDGVHVSDVISVLYGYDRTAPITNAERGRIELGKALERALLTGLVADTETLTEGWELEKDGIFGTFDALEPEHADLERLNEVKLTSMHVPDLPPGWPENIEDLFAYDKRFHKWVDQLMAYCWMYETPYGRLRAGFMRPDMTAEWRDWKVAFSEGDLAMNWAKIKATAEQIRKGLA